MATFLPMTGCTPAYTVPMPPSPSWPVTLYSSTIMPSSRAVSPAGVSKLTALGATESCSPDAAAAGGGGGATGVTSPELSSMVSAVWGETSGAGVGPAVSTSP